jgi:tyrosinase
LDIPDGGGRFEKSPIWDPDHGFGGNGKPSNKTVIPGPIPRGTGGGCVTDGPFKDTQFRIGPFGNMTKNNLHCLTRDINAAAVEKNGGISTIRKTLRAKNFKEFMGNVQRDFEDFASLLDGIGDLLGNASFLDTLFGLLKGSDSPPGGHANHGDASNTPKGGGGPLGFPLDFGFGTDLHFLAHGAIGGEVRI